MDAYLKKAVEDNNGKAIIINQCGGGLGDQIFIEPIMRKYHEEGYVVINVVPPECFWLNTYIQYPHYRTLKEMPGFDNEQCNADYKYHNIPVIPLRFANPLLRNIPAHCGDLRNLWMCDKYLYLGLPVDMWKSLRWTRNEAKENELFTLLGLKEGEYGFINGNYGGGFTQAGILTTMEFKVIYMRPIPGFTMLDWAKVIINAKEVHSVETSVIYLIEALPVKAKELHMYPRKPETTLDQVKNIISLDRWILHEELGIIF